MAPEKVGVVVIGRNEGDRLVACLRSLEPLGCPIVYVDSGSTDGSRVNAARLGAAVVELDRSSPFSAARARNEGFLKLLATYPSLEFVQFVDGDCVVNEGWLRGALLFLQEHEDVAVVCGHRREMYPRRSVYNQITNIEWRAPSGEVASCGGDSVMRARVVKLVGGFRSQLIAGEEPEICSRIRQNGWKVWRLDADMTLHDIALTHFSQWWRRGVRSGYGYAEVSGLLRTSEFQVFQREILRAMFWAGVLPLAALLGATFHPSSLLLLLAYPLQIVRIAMSGRASTMNPWIYALLMMVAKFAEIQGALKFYVSFVRTGKSRNFDYKCTQ